MLTEKSDGIGGATLAWGRPDMPERNLVYYEMFPPISSESDRGSIDWLEAVLHVELAESGRTEALRESDAMLSILGRSLAQSISGRGHTVELSACYFTLRPSNAPHELPRVLRSVSMAIQVCGDDNRSDASAIEELFSRLSIVRMDA